MCRGGALVQGMFSRQTLEVCVVYSYSPWSSLLKSLLCSHFVKTNYIDWKILKLKMYVWCSGSAFDQKTRQFGDSFCQSVNSRWLPMRRFCDIEDEESCFFWGSAGLSVRIQKNDFHETIRMCQMKNPLHFREGWASAKVVPPPVPLYLWSYPECVAWWHYYHCKLAYVPCRNGKLDRHSNRNQGKRVQWTAQIKNPRWLPSSSSVCQVKGTERLGASGG